MKELHGNLSRINQVLAKYVRIGNMAHKVFTICRKIFVLFPMFFFPEYFVQVKCYPMFILLFGGLFKNGGVSVRMFSIWLALPRNYLKRGGLLKIGQELSL